MTEDAARSFLRLIAVVIIMVGLSMALYTLVSLLGVSRAMSKAATAGMQFQMSGPLVQMGFFGVLADVAVSALGFALFAVSPRLATKIVE